MSGAMSPARILDMLLSGKVRLIRLTLPEGRNMFETATIVAEAGFCSREAFLSLCRDPEIIAALSVPSHSLEGFLFPETYFFSGGTPCRQIVKTLTTTFFSRFTPEWHARAQELGLSVQEVVTLASLIEKETGYAGERGLISSVFHNRLVRKMRLESDPTAVYGLESFEGPVRRHHLTRDTPYNTYRIPGLPLGPIASPGTQALESALFPENSDFLFFVSRRDGSHYFSRSFSEHNQAIQTYLKNR